MSLEIDESAVVILAHFAIASDAGDGEACVFAAPSPSLAAAGWSSPEARWAHNPEVDGSNPSPAIAFSGR